MAKQPVTRDRFRIFAEIEPEHLGLIVAALSRMGVQNIGHELITDVRTFHQNGERKAFETSAVDAVRAYMQEHPTFARKDLMAHFNAQGRSSGSTSTALTKLTKDGEIIALGDANYRRADVKEIEPPKEPKRSPTKRYDIPNDTLVLRAMKGRKKISVAGMRELLISEGRNGKSASPIISRFVAQKMLKQIEPGLYEVIEAKAKKTAKPSKANGHAKPDDKLAAAREADRLRAKARRDRLKAEREQQQQSQAEEANG